MFASFLQRECVASGDAQHHETLRGPLRECDSALGECASSKARYSCSASSHCGATIVGERLPAANALERRLDVKAGHVAFDARLHELQQALIERDVTDGSQLRGERRLLDLAKPDAEVLHDIRD